MKVRSGDFGAYPGSFPVAAFLDQILKMNIKNPEQLTFRKMELRTDQNQPVNEDTILLKVRDMPGTGGAYSEAYERNLETIQDLEQQIESELGFLEEMHGTELLLKALVQYAINHLGIMAFEDTLDLYKEDMERARREFFER